jgi:hypothetical protein
MIGYARPLVVWWVQEIRDQFRHDWGLLPRGDAVRDQWT